MNYIKNKKITNDCYSIESEQLIVNINFIAEIKRGNTNSDSTGTKVQYKSCLI